MRYNFSFDYVRVICIIVFERYFSLSLSLALLRPLDRHLGVVQAKDSSAGREGTHGGQKIRRIRQMKPDPLKRNKIYFGITIPDFTITRDPE